MSRIKELETALRALADWCNDTVPYFGEHERGSRADVVYRQAMKALGETLVDYDPDHDPDLIEAEQRAGIPPEPTP